MPHSGDRTVVTCAGDSEVRIFDLEYGGATNPARLIPPSPLAQEVGGSIVFSVRQGGSMKPTPMLGYTEAMRIVPNGS